MMEQICLSEYYQRKDGNWLNVHVQGEHDPISVCWKDVVSWNEIPEYEETLLLTSVEEMNQEILDAKAKELRNLKHNNVFEEVDYTNQSAISSKWVFTEKIKDGNKIVKARLVARGLKKNGLM